MDLNLDMLPKGPMDWSLDVLPSGPWIWIWTCFLEVYWNWILDVLPRGPIDLNLDVLPRGPMVWCLDVLPRGPMDLIFGCAFQRSNGIGRYYSYQCVWAFYPITCKINTFNSLKRLWHNWRMPLVWDIFHAPMNAEGGKLTWYCTTGEFGRGL